MWVSRLLLAYLFIGHSTAPTANAVQGVTILIQNTIYYCSSPLLKGCEQTVAT